MATGFKNNDNKDFDELFEPIEEGGGDSQTFRMYTKEGKDIGELFSPASQGEPADPVGFLKSGKDIGPLLCKKGSSNALPYKWATTTVSGVVEQNQWYLSSHGTGASTNTFYNIKPNTSVTSADGTNVLIPIIASSGKLWLNYMGLYDTSQRAFYSNSNTKPQIVCIQRLDTGALSILSPYFSQGYDSAISEFHLTLASKGVAFIDANDIGKNLSFKISVAPAEQFFDVVDGFTYSPVGGKYIQNVTFNEPQVVGFSYWNEYTYSVSSDGETVIYEKVDNYLLAPPSHAIKSFNETNCSPSIISTDSRYNATTFTMLADVTGNGGSRGLDLYSYTCSANADNTGFDIKGYNSYYHSFYNSYIHKIWILNRDRLFKYVNSI